MTCRLCYLWERKLSFQCVSYDYTAYMELGFRERPLNLLPHTPMGERDSYLSCIINTVPTDDLVMLEAGASAALELTLFSVEYSSFISWRLNVYSLYDDVCNTFRSCDNIIQHCIIVWVGSWKCSCLVIWFCYQLIMIAKTSNKTAAPPWTDPYVYCI